jgi:hypothetical protein
MQKQKLLLLLLALLLVLPHFSNAAGLVPCGGPTESACDMQDFFILIARVTNTLIAMAGMYAVYVICGAGFWLVVNGGDDEKRAGKIQAIQNAVVGFVLAMMAYLFINTAVNWLLKSKCFIDLRNPLLYLKIYDPSDPANDTYCKRSF